MYLRRAFYFLVLILFFPIVSKAFNGFTHQEPVGIISGKTIALEFVSSSVQDNMVQDAYLFYRVSGNLSFEQIPVVIEANRFIANLTIDNETAESVEYYLSVELLDGSIATFPSQNAETNPVRVALVTEEQEVDSEISGLSGEIQYNILSPEPGEVVSEDDVVIAITMFYAEGDALPETFRVIYNGRDVTESASVSPFFISYVPRRTTVGNQRISIMVSDADGEREVAGWGFEIITEREMLALETRRRNIPNARVELSARNQSFGGNTAEIYRASSRVSGTIGSNVRYSVSGLITSQESSRLQPQNRFAGEIAVGNWFELQAGHVYPRLSPLLLSGRRVYGLNTRLGTPRGGFQIQAVAGQMSRSVTMQYSDVQKQILTLGQTSGGEVVQDTVYSLGLQPRGMGTYQRNIYGGRVSFGRNIQFGLSGLKVEDDINSISVIREFDDIMANGQAELLSSLTPSQRAELIADPDLFRINAGTPRSQGNFVLGSDFAVNANNNRIQFRSDAAVSFLNNDISSGVINQEWADDFGIDLDEDFENILDRLQTIIIVNENMSVFPVDISNGDLDMDLLLSMTAAQTRLGLNYFNHNFSVQYRFIGPNYTSLGNNSIRRDIQGFTISDRFRMINNTVFVSLSYENLSDNLARTREATTNTVNYRGSVSWFPVPRHLPRVTVNLRYQTRDNGVERYFNPLLLDATGSPIDSRRAVRNVLFADLDNPVFRPAPRSTNTLQYGISLTQFFEAFGQNHEATIGFNEIDTIDDVFFYGDFKSQTYNLGISTGYSGIPLRTDVNASYNLSTSQSGLTDISIFGLNTAASYFLLDNKLNLRLDFAVTFNEVESTPLVVANSDTQDFFDDYFTPDETQRTKERSNTYVIRGGARYNITNNHALILDANFTNVVLIGGVGTLPNDRLIQARYVFNF